MHTRERERQGRGLCLVFSCMCSPSSTCIDGGGLEEQQSTYIHTEPERAGGLGDAACKSPEALAGNYRGGSKMWVGGLPGEMVDGYTQSRRNESLHTYIHVHTLTSLQHKPRAHTHTYIKCIKLLCEHSGIKNRFCVFSFLALSPFPSLLDTYLSGIE